MGPQGVGQDVHSEELNRYRVRMYLSQSFTVLGVLVIFPVLFFWLVLWSGNPALILFLLVLMMIWPIAALTFLIRMPAATLLAFAIIAAPASIMYHYAHDWGRALPYSDELTNELNQHPNVARSMAKMNIIAIGTNCSYCSGGLLADLFADFGDQYLVNSSRTSFRDWLDPLVFRDWEGGTQYTYAVAVMPGGRLRRVVVPAQSWQIANGVGGFLVIRDGETLKAYSTDRLSPRLSAWVTKAAGDWDGFGLIATTQRDFDDAVLQRVMFGLATISYYIRRDPGRVLGTMDFAEGWTPPAGYLSIQENIYLHLHRGEPGFNGFKGRMGELLAQADQELAHPPTLVWRWSGGYYKNINTTTAATRAECLQEANESPWHSLQKWCKPFVRTIPGDWTQFGPITAYGGN